MTTKTDSPTLLADPMPEGFALRAVKVNQALSEETLCFSATLYVDGKKAATVGNRGHGGPDEWTWASDAVEASTLARVPVRAYDPGHGMPATTFEGLTALEIAVAEAAELVGTERACKRFATKHRFPIILYAIHGHRASIIGIRDEANVPKYLAEVNATEYRVFRFPEFAPAA